MSFGIGEARVSDEAAFLSAIEAAPDDDVLRLVYADWLDERGRLEGTFVRIECALTHLQREWKREAPLRAQFRVESRDGELVPADEFEAYLRPRARLVARLMDASRGLDPEWVVRVCRADTRWLRRRLTIEQAAAENMVRDPRLGPDPVPFGWCYSRWCELLNKLEPGDELWEYDSPKEDWYRLMGSSGIALLRNGVVIDTMACKMN
jgi:uncharacterized protein (TIGR02996 family)